MKAAPFGILHLAGRFFHFLAASPLDDEESERVRSLLSPAECAMFFAQPAQDQRHAFEAALFVPDELHAAALLHDVGKRHSRLGALGRVIASIIGMLGLPARGRFALYLEHGPIAADELNDIGSDTITVAYARHHHGERPTGVDARTWRSLEEADRVVVRRHKASQDTFRKVKD